MIKLGKGILIVVMVLLSSIGYAQSDKDKAVDLCKEAIHLMDNGDVKKSLELLDQARELDPKNMTYIFETGYAYYISGDFAEAVVYFKKAMKDKKLTDTHFTMLGNAYDSNKQPKKALATYLKGIKKFPNSGKLYVELGILALNNELINEAITYWEKGVEVEPNYASNYYYLTTMFCQSQEPIWGLMYGEIFRQLEPKSNRSIEISKLLFDTYAGLYEAKSDTSGTFNLTKKGFQIVVTDVDDLMKSIKKGRLLPFEGTYATSFTIAGADWSLNPDSVSIDKIHNLRQRFVNNWFGDKKDYKNFPNTLLDYQKKVSDAGYLKYYDYWIFLGGHIDSFEAWYEVEENNVKFGEFLEWYNSNPLMLTKKNYVHRLQYE